ncbi:nucleotide exchange factor GrpE [Aequorivita marina]|uniref:nucleotide exchange factor GrpE n=1 Tax=Aequorivita marina TaxID=3073654 RepID=UPI0028763C46|nr:nucleotide exchange factor GrpE [Aequorivita sp. S2608]MDS1299286.1 nucleotide exchange factor GrpE [Aequorivita sp. S2608]
MAVLLLPSEKNERNAIMSKNDKNKETDHEEVVLEDTKRNEQEVAEENVTDAISELQDEFQREKERYLRLFAEFENYKKRTSRERVEMFKTAGEDVIGSLLPVLDDFERALKEIESMEDDSHFKGVGLINNKLRETLRSKGLEMMEVKTGDTFDADSHEAVTQIPAPEKKLKGKIIDVVEKGYTLGDKIIRYPKVVIGQ